MNIKAEGVWMERRETAVLVARPFTSLLDPLSPPLLLKRTLTQLTWI